MNTGIVGVFLCLNLHWFSVIRFWWWGRFREQNSSFLGPHRSWICGELWKSKRNMEWHYNEKEQQLQKFWLMVRVHQPWEVRTLICFLTLYEISQLTTRRVKFEWHSAQSRERKQQNLKKGSSCCSWNSVCYILWFAISIYTNYGVYWFQQKWLPNSCTTSPHDLHTFGVLYLNWWKTSLN